MLVLLEHVQLGEVDLQVQGPDAHEYCPAVRRAGRVVHLDPSKGRRVIVVRHIDVTNILGLALALQIRLYFV